MRIGLMVPDLTPHDAVGNDVFGMYLTLNAQGHECRIFTLSGETRHPIRVYHYEDMPFFLNNQSDLIIFHYCTSDSQALRAIRQSPARVIVKYHNLTPPHFMAPYNKDFALACKRARDDLRDVCDLPLVWVLSDSDYNNVDIAPLLPESVGRSTVAPMHRISELLESPDDPQTQSLLDHAWFNILTVGRVVPNKAIDLMMPALGKLRAMGIVGVRLHIAGGRDPRLAEYTARIDGLIAAHGLQGDIVWHHAISTSKLATLYRHCDALWTTSQHEGFCVPVIEAMAFELPVISTRKSALPETCGSAALFGDHADEMARQLYRLATDDTLRAKLGEAGGRRFREVYSHRALEQRFMAEIEKIASTVHVQAPADDADWFGLPFSDGIEQISDAAATHGAPLLLASVDGRRNFVDWIVRNGATGIWLTAGVRAGDLREYARQLPVPAVATHLGPEMRFAWHFNPVARSQFTLQNNADLASFLLWFRDVGAASYEGVFHE